MMSRGIEYTVDLCVFEPITLIMSDTSTRDCPDLDIVSPGQGRGALDIGRFINKNKDITEEEDEFIILIIVI